MSETKPENTCPHCEVGDLITILMTVGDKQVSFSACDTCEAKWWQTEGEEIPLGNVLADID